MKISISLKAIAFFLLMLFGIIAPTMSLAQRSDGFFCYNNDIYENRVGENGITIGNMQNDNPIPLGSGLLILTAFGAGYAIYRRRSSYKTHKSYNHGATLLIASLVLLGLTQCKKNDIAPTPDGDTVFMTLDASCGGGRTVFDPSVPGIRWGTGSNEFISVGSSVKGYLGELSGTGNGTNEAITFSGTITAPAGTQGEKLYFFYLGNGRHYGYNSLDFSNQENSAGAHFVTDYVIAIGEGTVTNSGGSTYTATADLEVKTAIAYFNISAFSTGSDDDNVYLRGNDVYSTATIDYRDGTITGNAKGSINMGSTNESNKYIALIPSVSTETTLIFEGATKEGSLTFLRGIQANRYYSDDGEALEITGKESYVFTVSDYPAKRIRFSPGNLQYKTGTGWRFAEHQYDVCQTSNGSWNTSGWVDLFGWGTWSGTSEHWNPTNTSTFSGEYSWEGDYYDDVYFHGSLTNHTAAGWFTLSRDQWQYIIDYSRHGLATITVGGNDIHGMVILPDNSELSINTSGSSWSDNVYSESQWVTNMEAKGAVFLPATGYREGTNVYDYGDDYYYWSCTEEGGSSAWYLSSNEYGTYPERYWGLGVRLVR